MLALLEGEPGADRVAQALLDDRVAVMVSTVNLSEVASWLARVGRTRAQVARGLAPFLRHTVVFDAEQAVLSGELVVLTKAVGLSLGDRACLALARSRGAIALTADRLWLQVDVGVKVESIR